MVLVLRVYDKRILGSNQPYIRSTNMLIITNKEAITSTAPIIMGKSNVLRASTISFS